jgi:hypothetical protein
VEWRVEAWHEIGLRKRGGERADRPGVAREMRSAGHPIRFERQPTGPHITEIGDHHPDTLGARYIRRDDVVGPLVTMEQQVGNAALSKQCGNKSRPFIKAAAKIDGRQPPKQPIAEIEVDAMHAMAARDQRPCNALEEIRLRAL